LELQTTEDNPEERAERFERHADNAQDRSDAAYQRTRQIGDRIPFGQPILVGHHSEAGHRRDIARMQNGMRVSVEESKKAEYWRRRADRAVKNAEYKQKPGVIKRRIERLEADLRRCQREVKSAENRGQTDRHSQRWVDHIEMRLGYERNLYEESGGVPTDKEDGPVLEVGGAVWSWGKWCEIVRVNKKTVSVKTPYTWVDKIAKDRIAQTLSKAEWDERKG